MPPFGQHVAEAFVLACAVRPLAHNVRTCTRSLARNTPAYAAVELAGFRVRTRDLRPRVFATSRGVLCCSPKHHLWFTTWLAPASSLTRALHLLETCRSTRPSSCPPRPGSRSACSTSSPRTCKPPTGMSPDLFITHARHLQVYAPCPLRLARLATRLEPRWIFRVPVFSPLGSYSLASSRHLFSACPIRSHVTHIHRFFLQLQLYPLTLNTPRNIQPPPPPAARSTGRRRASRHSRSKSSANS